MHLTSLTYSDDNIVVYEVLCLLCEEISPSRRALLLAAVVLGGNALEIVGSVLIDSIGLIAAFTEDVPALSTSLSYGLYMEISSNLRPRADLYSRMIAVVVLSNGAFCAP
ncbi:hypothetical protein POTOM_031158 [Populus tomentosa]|uniref:Uncharacterized protein n=1 Tax=Populus tomentosa TaxID=118781 RepID=A0A8X7Z6X6_POPTO|nr:hypothetical protein POTOM_031158 [Populus tomentosa]